jgi:hypothetical protein
MGSLSAGVGVEDQLRQPISVAQVDEDEIAVVAIGMDPTGQANGAVNVNLAELAAGVRAITGFDGFHN